MKPPKAFCFAAMVCAASFGCFAADVPSFVDSPGKRLCAHRGLSAVLPENTLPAYGAVVAMGAGEIEFDLWWTKDGEIVSIHDPTLERVANGKGKVYEHTFAEIRALDFGTKPGGAHFAGLKAPTFEDILAQFARRTIMNIHVKDLGGKPWKEAHLKKVIKLIDAYGARKHVYFMTASVPIQKQLARLAPDIPRCMGNNAPGVDKTNKTHPNIVDRAVACKCNMVQLFKPYFDQALIDQAKAAGLRVNVCWADDPEEAKLYFEMGADTVLTNDYQPVSSATGVK